MIDIQRKTGLAFERALPTYDNEAIVQKIIAKRLVEFYRSSTSAKQLSAVFEFGCGTGLLTKSLLSYFKADRYIANDIVKKCGDAISTVFPIGQKYEFLHGDIADVCMPPSCELIISSSCVQWVTNLPRLLNRINAHLSSSGILAISTFGPEQFCELSNILHSGGKSDRSRPLNYLNIDEWKTLLKEDFDVLVLHESYETLCFNSVLALLQHLRKTGVNGNAKQRWNKQSLVDFDYEYRRKFSQGDSLRLTYHPVYIIARKKGVKRV